MASLVSRKMFDGDKVIKGVQAQHQSVISSMGYHSQRQRGRTCRWIPLLRCRRRLCRQRHQRGVRVESIVLLGEDPSEGSCVGERVKKQLVYAPIATICYSRENKEKQKWDFCFV